MFHGNETGHTEGSGKRKLVIIYVQRGTVNAQDKLSFREQEEVHPSGWRMLA